MVERALVLVVCLIIAELLKVGGIGLKFTG